MRVHLDIETRSEADLPETGAYRYACHPSTRVMMAAVSEDRIDAPVYLWVNPLYRDAGVASDPEALLLLAQADEVYAHNADFEVPLTRARGPVEIPLERWRCTQAMARMAGLPESLEKCGEALGIEAKKDRKGKDLIRFFSVPQEGGDFNEPRDHPEKWAQFCEYCRQDVRAEREIHRTLGHKFSLTGPNLDTFQFTLRMNAEGIPVNTRALVNAQRMIDEVQAGAGSEFRSLTGLNITQRAKVLDWLRARGLALENMQAETLQSLDLTKAEPEVARVVSLYIQLSYAAVKKVTSMLNWVMPDDRLRGVMKFHGAGTGRWSAGGPQIQNAKKPTPAMRPLTKLAYAAISNGAGVEAISAVYGDPLEVISSCIRHFVHAHYDEMLDADYNAIEARVICWLAKEKEMLALWAKGADLYKRMASLIYNVPQSHVTADQRDMGKRTILGAGYGMGAVKFRATCEQFGVDCDEELAERAISVYRETHPFITAYWRRLQADATSAVRVHGSRHNEFWCESAAGRTYLFCRLPSGRKLAYPDPLLEHDAQFGEQLTYWGQIPMSSQMGRIKLYGGKLAENICQAVAADLMSHGARTAEQRGMRPFALIHDQGLAIRGDHSAEEFAAALGDLPAWAKGLPLKVEAKVTPFYSK